MCDKRIAFSIKRKKKQKREKETDIICSLMNICAKPMRDYDLYVMRL